MEAVRMAEAEGSSYCWPEASCCQDLLLGSALGCFELAQNHTSAEVGIFTVRNNLGFSTSKRKKHSEGPGKVRQTGGFGDHQLLLVCRNEPSGCISHIQPCHLTGGKTSSVCLSVRAEGNAPHTLPTKDLDTEAAE